MTGKNTEEPNPFPFDCFLLTFGGWWAAMADHAKKYNNNAWIFIFSTIFDSWLLTDMIEDDCAKMRTNAFRVQFFFFPLFPLTGWKDFSRRQKTGTFCEDHSSESMETWQYYRLRLFPAAFRVALKMYTFVCLYVYRLEFLVVYKIY